MTRDEIKIGRRYWVKLFPLASGSSPNVYRQKIIRSLDDGTYIVGDWDSQHIVEESQIKAVIHPWWEFWRTK